LKEEATETLMTNGAQMSHYLPSEITWLLKSFGFRKIEIFGAKIEGCRRNRRLIGP